MEAVVQLIAALIGAAATIVAPFIFLAYTTAQPALPSASRPVSPSEVSEPRNTMIVFALASMWGVSSGACVFLVSTAIQAIIGGEAHIAMLLAVDDATTGGACCFVWYFLSSILGFGRRFPDRKPVRWLAALTSLSGGFTFAFLGNLVWALMLAPRGTSVDEVLALMNVFSDTVVAAAFCAILGVVGLELGTGDYQFRPLGRKLIQYGSASK
jgi:hypothetical protein